jgi:hypothetical protein
MSEQPSAKFPVCPKCGHAAPGGWCPVPGCDDPWPKEPSAEAVDFAAKYVFTQASERDEIRDTIVVFERLFWLEDETPEGIAEEAKAIRDDVASALDAYAAARVAEAVAAAVLEREREIVAVIAGLPRHSDRAGRRMISWFDVQMILRGIESEAAAGPQGDAP